MCTVTGGKSLVGSERILCLNMFLELYNGSFDLGPRRHSAWLFLYGVVQDEAVAMIVVKVNPYTIHSIEMMMQMLSNYFVAVTKYRIVNVVTELINKSSGMLIWGN